MVLLICKDLMFVSKVQTACRQMSKPLTTSNSVDQAIEKIESGEVEISQIFLDLKSSGQIETLEKLAEFTQRMDTPISVTAFGPHVKVDLLKAAKEAGFERVWTQGKFHSSFTELL